MRTLVFAMFLAFVIASPRTAGAQVFRNETPPPAVTAAGASWQLNGEPVFYAGTFYDPSGPTVFFDGKVMVRTGVYQGVPLYEDGTLQPYSIVYVPVGGVIMRPYVRRNDEARYGAVGTSGRLPLDFAEDSRGGLLERGYALVPVDELRALRGRGRPETEPEFEPVGVVSVAPSRSASTGAAATTQGLWIEFSGARWFSTGRAVNYDASRFEPIGDYRGFPVYRERGATGERIFVTSVHDGPVAPFERR